MPESLPPAGYQPAIHPDSLRESMVGFSEPLVSFILWYVESGLLDKVPIQLTREYQNGIATLDRKRQLRLITPREWGAGLASLTPPQQRWQVYLEVLCLYLFGFKQKAEIAERVGISKQTVELQIKMVVGWLWRNAPEEIKASWPREQLSVVRQQWVFNPQQMQDRLALIGKIKSGEINNGNITSQQRSKFRLLLGPDKDLLPLTRAHTNKSEQLQVMRQLRRARTDEEAQALLDKVTRRTLLADVNSSRPILIDVTALVRPVLNISSRDVKTVARVLRSAGVPIGTREQYVASGAQAGTRFYYFILRRDAQRAIDAILADPNLTQFKRVE